MTKVEQQNRLRRLRRQAGRLILKPVTQVSGLIIRTFVASLVFYASAAIALSSMGYPVPRLSDLGHYLGRLSELAKILS